jgi:hypothetical protein
MASIHVGRSLMPFVVAVSVFSCGVSGRLGRGFCRELYPTNNWRRRSSGKTTLTEVVIRVVRMVMVAGSDFLDRPRPRLLAMQSQNTVGRTRSAGLRAGEGIRRAGQFNQGVTTTKHCTCQTVLFN